MYISAFETLRNALYKFKTYLLTYLLPDDGNLVNARRNKEQSTRELESKLRVSSQATFRCRAITDIKGPPYLPL